MLTFAVFLATRATRHYCVAAAASAVVAGYAAMFSSTWLSPVGAAGVALVAGILFGCAYHAATRRLLVAGAREAYLLLVSLAAFSVVSALADVTAGGRGAMVPWLTDGDIGGLPASRVLVLLVRLLVISFALLLWIRAGVGIRLRALGEDRDALSLRGVNVARLEVLTGVAAFAVASLEGILLTFDGQLTAERAFTGSLWGVAITLAMQFTRENFLVLTVGALGIALVLVLAPYVLEGDWSVAIGISIVASVSVIASQRFPRAE
jgi:branched-subunit amino acid ABC-type transport system permease component